MPLTARHTASLAAALLFLACSRPADPTRATDVIIGEWEKVERSMPPVNLVISRHSDGDRARLRLSGVDRFGTVTTNGNRVVLHFAGTPDVTGEIVSSTEMTLNLDQSLTAILRKRVP
jgi:hypothetical protein